MLTAEVTGRLFCRELAGLTEKAASSRRAETRRQAA